METDDTGVTLIARGTDGSIAMSQYLPGPSTPERIQLDAADLAESTSLPVEIHHRQPNFPVHIGRRLDPRRSRLTDMTIAGAVCEALPSEVEIGVATLLPRHQCRSQGATPIA